MTLVDKEREHILRLHEEAKDRGIVPGSLGHLAGAPSGGMSALVIPPQDSDPVSNEPLVATLTVSAQVGSSVVVVSAPLVDAVDRLMQAMDAAPAITDEPARVVVHQIGVDANRLLKEVDVQRQMAVAPFLEAQKAINAAAKAITDDLGQLVAEVRSQEEDFINERDRQLALAEAERKRAEAVAELERQKAMAAARLSAAGPAAVVAPPPFVRPTAALTPIPQAAPTAVPMTSKPEVVVIDESKVPAEYWVLDMVRIRRDALAGKLTGADGIEVRKTKRVVLR